MNDQQGLVPELWQVVNPGRSVFDQNAGTTVLDMLTLAQHLAAPRFPVHFHMESLAPDPAQLLAALDADDQGGIVQVIDSCKTVDFGSDRYTPEQLIEASRGVTGGVGPSGWVVTVLNEDKSQQLARVVMLVVDLSVITPVQGFHWIISH